MKDLNESLKEIREVMEEVMSKYDEDATEAWSKLTYEQQGQAFYYVVKNIMKGEKEGYSYRGMLYDVFDFEPDMYGVGMQAGYLDLHNMLYDYFHGEKE